MRKTLIAVGVVFTIFYGVSRAQAEKGWLATVQGVGFVAKVDVSNLELSTQWYVEKLGLVHEKKFDAPTWRQLRVPGLNNTAVGLNLNPGKVPAKNPPNNCNVAATTTFVVKDIVKERSVLDGLGVTISEVIPVGEGVCLAFFSDPDKNPLGLRENGCPLKPKS